MNSPLVSIVLPVYNGEDRMERSIQSVIDQTYQNWELIIVNDCSTDDSLEKAQKFALADDRIKVLSHEKNKKLPAALNTGFRQANGEFLTWTSHDNEFKPDALEKMVAFMQGNPEIGLVYANEEIINELNGDKKLSNKSSIDGIIFGNVVGACFLYRKNVKEVVGEYDESLFLAKDYDYWLRVWKNCKCQHIDDLLYRYYFTDKALTATQKPGVVRSTLRAIQKNLLKNKIVPEELEEEFLMRWFKYWFKYSYKPGNGNYKIMLLILSKLMRSHPVSFFSFIAKKQFVP